MNYGCLWLPGSSPYLEAAECTPLPNPYFTQGTCGGFVPQTGVSPGVSPRHLNKEREGSRAESINSLESPLLA